MKVGLPALWSQWRYYIPRSLYYEVSHDISRPLLAQETETETCN